jgi:hypothetical protein
MERKEETVREYTIEMSTANLYGTGLMILLTILFFGFYEICWSGIFSGTALLSLKKSQGFLLCAAIIIGIGIHELIHGVTWAIYCKNGFASIAFGFSWKAFAPYCHCKEPLTLDQYRKGVIMPLIILGLLPLTYSYLEGNFWLFLFGWLFTIAAAGDVIALWILRKLDKATFVQDHESKVGCYLYENQQPSP